jgi:hypothetical protein
MARTLRPLCRNTAYVGDKNYPRIIEDEQWQAVQSILDGLTPVDRAYHRGGRRPIDNTFMLRGICFCAECGAPMHVKRDVRTYSCRERHLATGLCSSRQVPADVADKCVLKHLHWFVGSVDDWIAERLRERDGERDRAEAAVTVERATLATLEAIRVKLCDRYEAVIDDDRLARLALEAVGRKDDEIEAQQSKIADAEARVAEHSTTPDVDAALDLYRHVAATVDGIPAGAEVEVINETLRGLVAAIYLAWDGHALTADVRVRASSAVWREQDFTWLGDETDERAWEAFKRERLGRPRPGLKLKLARPSWPALLDTGATTTR